MHILVIDISGSGVETGVVDVIHEGRAMTAANIDWAWIGTDVVSLFVSANRAASAGTLKTALL